MLKSTLDVKFCRTHDNKPLTIVDGLPGDYAALNPDELRAIANALLKIADDCKSIPMSKRTYNEQRASYKIK